MRGPGSDSTALQRQLEHAVDAYTLGDEKI